jgi:hypothetical protein
VLDIFAKGRPLFSAGAKGAESGVKGRQIQRPFHSDCDPNPNLGNASDIDEAAINRVLIDWKCGMELRNAILLPQDETTLKRSSAGFTNRKVRFIILSHLANHASSRRVGLARNPSNCRQ